MRQYNEIINFINREYHVPTACPVLPVASGAKSENGMCVAVSLGTGLVDTPPALRDTEFVLIRAGGAAGIRHEVRITPEGQLFISDEHRPEIALGFLPDSQGNQLNASLEDWNLLPAISAEIICCDGFGWGITYRGKTLSWSEGQENVPDRLWKIAALVASFETGTVISEPAFAARE